MATRTPNRSPATRAAALKVLPGVVLMLVVLLVAANIFKPVPSRYLQLDGRPATEFEAPSAASLASQKWMRQVEAWANDRVPRRANLLELHAYVETRLLRSPVADGVYVDSETGFGLRRSGLPKPRLDALGSAATSLRAALGDTPLVWVDVPSREEAFADRLPPGWEADFDLAAAGVRSTLEPTAPYVDLREVLVDPAAREDYFMRTDHHWSAEGALAATDLLVVALAEAGVDLSGYHPDYERVVFDGPYMGSVGRVATLGSTLAPEAFTAMVPAAGFSATLCEAGVCDEPAFNVSAADQRRNAYVSRYLAFTGSNVRERHLHNDDAPFDFTLVLAKDSFGNPVGLYLSELVTDVYMLDERKLGDQTVAGVARSVGADAVIVLHPTSSYYAAKDVDRWS